MTAPLSHRQSRNVNVFLLLLCAAVILQGCGKGASATQSCPANLVNIAGAKLEWSIDRGKRPDDVPSVEDLVGPTNYLRAWPKCPEGGTYTIGKVKEDPRCTIPDHNFPTCPSAK